MERYWENGSGYYDPTLAKAISNENTKESKARNKEIHDTIREIKNLLSDKDLELAERIIIKDKITNKKYD